MRIKNILLIITAITIVSCNDASKSETYRLLEGIDKSELTSKELEAKYALLLSQALDKNFIDLQSDSIIAPAVNYYKMMNALGHCIMPEECIRMLGILKL